MNTLNPNTSYYDMLNIGDQNKIAKIAGCSPAYVARIAKIKDYKPKTIIQARVWEALKLTAKYYEALEELGKQSIILQPTKLAS